MDAVKFLQTWSRMCDEGWCATCPLGILSNDNCNGWVFAHPAKAVAIVEEWDAEYPAKTNADKFKEVFGVQPSPAGYQQNHTRAAGMPVEWWGEPYEEPKEDA